MRQMGCQPCRTSSLAPVAKYGYLGVELFFMISGFVILMTAANGSLKGFLISRFVRLYPAFWACCTLTFVTILALGAPRYEASLAQYLINMTMTSAFVGVAEIDGSYWSLFVEMKFYGLVALVLLLGQIRHSQLLLVLWLHRLDRAGNGPCRKVARAPAGRLLLILHCRRRMFPGVVARNLAHSDWRDRRLVVPRCLAIRQGPAGDLKSITTQR